MDNYFLHYMSKENAIDFVSLLSIWDFRWMLGAHGFIILVYRKAYSWMTIRDQNFIATKIIQEKIFIGMQSRAAYPPMCY